MESRIVYYQPLATDRYVLDPEKSDRKLFSAWSENRDTKITKIIQTLDICRLFSVSAAALRAGPLPVGKELPVQLVGKKSSQGIGLGASPYGGNIYFAPLSETAIAQFNPKTNEQK